MHNDTSRKGTRTKICFAPVTILKASSKIQLFSCSSQGPGPAGNDRERMDAALELPFPLSCLGSIQHLPAQNLTLGQPHGPLSPSTLTQTEARGMFQDSVRWRGLSPDTGCTLRPSKAGICQAAGSASRLLSLIGTGFSSVCSVTS